jgi:hypothetical protein
MEMIFRFVFHGRGDFVNDACEVPSSTNSAVLSSTVVENAAPFGCATGAVQRGTEVPPSPNRLAFFQGFRRERRSSSSKLVHTKRLQNGRLRTETLSICDGEVCDNLRDGSSAETSLVVS